MFCKTGHIVTLLCYRRQSSEYKQSLDVTYSIELYSRTRLILIHSEEQIDTINDISLQILNNKVLSFRLPRNAASPASVIL